MVGAEPWCGCGWTQRSRAGTSSDLHRHCRFDRQRRYGFDTIHMSLGDTALVDQSGAVAIIKPIALVAPGLNRLGHRLPAALAVIAEIVWPVATSAASGRWPSPSTCCSSWPSAPSCGESVRRRTVGSGRNRPAAAGDARDRATIDVVAPVPFRLGGRTVAADRA